jgi:hypothetical protein
MIIDFSNFDDPKAFEEFYSAWSKARKDNALPIRRDIELRAFAQHASNISIVERTAPDFYTHRLFGSQITSRFGKSDPEVNVLKYHSPDVQDGIQEWADSILDGKCGGYGKHSTAYVDGSHRASQILSLPVQTSTGKIIMFSLQRAFKLLRVTEPRETPCLGLDFSFAAIFDIGFDVPNDGERIIVNKTKPETSTA